MAERSSRTALKRALGTQLKRLREQAGKSRADVSDRLGKTAAWPGHIETGRNLPSPSDIELLLTWFGVPERVDFFLQVLARAKRGRDWWIDFDDEQPEWFSVYLGNESVLRASSGYDAMLPHGLIQTPDYAEAVIRRVHPTLKDAEVEARVKIRMVRQERVENGELELCRVVDEAALRRRCGGSTPGRRGTEAGRGCRAGAGGRAGGRSVGATRAGP
uniref:Scr1 family TA system antitoxin-like transcriptional regulator n=1 Tax=Amycolatopsis sp. CA-290885 TaxID=3239925 RepID=UPI003F493DDC